MPKYDVECTTCKHTHIEQMTFDQYDMNAKGFKEFCEQCSQDTMHKIIITRPPGIEWRTDGATLVDWADPHTKYQREHFQESGDRTERKIADRNRKRRGK